MDAPLSLAINKIGWGQISSVGEKPYYIVLPRGRNIKLIFLHMKIPIQATRMLIWTQSLSYCILRLEYISRPPRITMYPLISTFVSCQVWTLIIMRNVKSPAVYIWYIKNSTVLPDIVWLSCMMYDYDNDTYNSGICELYLRKQVIGVRTIFRVYEFFWVEYPGRLLRSRRPTTFGGCFV